MAIQPNPASHPAIAIPTVSTQTPTISFEACLSVITLPHGSRQRGEYPNKRKQRTTNQTRKSQKNNAVEKIQIYCAEKVTRAVALTCGGFQLE
jgi:hypothetical protein